MFEACATVAATIAFYFWGRSGPVDTILSMMFLFLALWGVFETAAALGFITPA